VKAIVLAAGYATRLRPLTDHVPKQLLPVGGRPILDHVVEKIEEIADVDAIYVVTNARFAPDFEGWAADRRGRVRPAIVDDGSSSNETRLGAIGDIDFTVRTARLEYEDLLVVAGDNLFDFSLRDFVAFWREKRIASCLAVYDVGDRELARQYGVVALDDDDRVVSFVEKPAEPASTLAATAAYIYDRHHVPLIARYVAEGNVADQPGHLVAWLLRHEPVYGYRFVGEWFDIGSPAQLLEADNRFRARSGLPARGEYALDPTT
jgi:glucose-1-phosphate thymidylyltransferase